MCLLILKQHINVSFLQWSCCKNDLLVYSPVFWAEVAKYISFLNSCLTSQCLFLVKWIHFSTPTIMLTIPLELLIKLLRWLKFVEFGNTDILELQKFLVHWQVVSLNWCSWSLACLEIFCTQSISSKNECKEATVEVRRSIFVKSDCSLLRFKCVYSNCIFWFGRNSLMQWWGTFPNLILRLDFSSDLLYGSSNPLEQHPPPQVYSEFPWSPAKRYRGHTEELSFLTIHDEIRCKCKRPGGFLFFFFTSQKYWRRKNVNVSL